MSNRFGRRLYEIFFKNYTEKVWGMKCSEIGADWAAQRIKNLDLNKLVKDMFIGTKNNAITTLITSFLYPRLGPGMLWENVAQRPKRPRLSRSARSQGNEISSGKREARASDVTNGDGRQERIRR